MVFREFVSHYRQGLNQCHDELPLEKLERVAEILLRAQREKRRVFFLGNGGSASTASHMAVDFGKNTAPEGYPRLRAISLTDNIGVITAWANDSKYEDVFREQLENLLEPLDIIIAISVSGNSPNVLQAVEFGRKRGAVTIGLIGFGGGKLKDYVDIDITVSSRNFGQVEDFHLSVEHILSQYLREQIQLHAPAKDDGTNKEPHLKFFFSQPPASGSRAGILLDRDGVINERVIDGYVTSWSEFRFREGITSALAALSRLNLPIVVISNQAGVGKHLFSPETLKEITDRFVSMLKDHHVRIDAVYYCPHTAKQDCGCRKPRAGLLEAAARDWKLDLKQSVFIGDSECDLETARRINCHAVLFPSNHSASTIARKQLGSHFFVTVTDASKLFGEVSRLLPTTGEQ